MRSLFRVSSFLLLGLFVLPSLAKAQDRHAEAFGIWKSIDDKTKEPKSHVKIWEENGKLYGKIIRLFRKPTEEQNPTCDKCEGDRKDKPVIGMLIIWDLTKNANGSWHKGRILDPANGKTYGCWLETLEGGKKLKVRGYMGVSLFGRTQMWEKVASNPEAPKPAEKK